MSIRREIAVETRSTGGRVLTMMHGAVVQTIGDYYPERRERQRGLPLRKRIKLDRFEQS